MIISRGTLSSKKRKKGIKNKKFSYRILKQTVRLSPTMTSFTTPDLLIPMMSGSAKYLEQLDMVCFRGKLNLKTKFFFNFNFFFRLILIFFFILKIAINSNALICMSCVYEMCCLLLAINHI